MNISRREVLAGLGSMAAWSGTSGVGSGALSFEAKPSRGGGALPAKHDFSIPAGLTYLNSALTHPIPKAGLEALRDYGDRRAHPEIVSKPLQKSPVDIKAEFAALINAKKSEISFIPNTSTGENLVVNGLDIPRSGGNVVTDELHFDGALLHLQALQQKAGLDLRIVKTRDWRIDLKDLERTIDKKTKLVEISGISRLRNWSLISCPAILPARFLTRGGLIRTPPGILRWDPTTLERHRSSPNPFLISGAWVWKIFTRTGNLCLKSCTRKCRVSTLSR
jgi:Aminotransferase class-V